MLAEIGRIAFQFGDEAAMNFARRRGRLARAEILGDIGCERGSIAFGREQVVGAEGEDLLGDLG